MKTLDEILEAAVGSFVKTRTNKMIVTSFFHDIRQSLESYRKAYMIVVYREMEEVDFVEDDWAATWDAMAAAELNYFRAQRHSNKNRSTK